MKRAVKRQTGSLLFYSLILFCDDSDDLNNTEVPYFSNALFKNAMAIRTLRPTAIHIQPFPSTEGNIILYAMTPRAKRMKKSALRRFDALLDIVVNLHYLYRSAGTYSVSTGLYHSHSSVVIPYAAAGLYFKGITDCFFHQSNILRGGAS